MEKIIKLAQHNVKIWIENVEDNYEISNSTEEYIVNLIVEWYVEGEVCEVIGDEEYRGWWSIEK